MENMKDQKIDAAELKSVAGGIVYKDQKLVCPKCGEDKLHGNEELGSDNVWHIRWYCPRCKESVLFTPM